jgi:hypothetical protein
VVVVVHKTQTKNTNTSIDKVDRKLTEDGMIELKNELLSALAALG